jgi:hypothetical protein
MNLSTLKILNLSLFAIVCVSSATFGDEPVTSIGPVYLETDSPEVQAEKNQKYQSCVDQIVVNLQYTDADYPIYEFQSKKVAGESDVILKTSLFNDNERLIDCRELGWLDAIVVWTPKFKKDFDKNITLFDVAFELGFIFDSATEVGISFFEMEVSEDKDVDLTQLPLPSEEPYKPVGVQLAHDEAPTFYSSKTHYTRVKEGLPRLKDVSLNIREDEIYLIVVRRAPGDSIRTYLKGRIIPADDMAVTAK